MQEAYGLGVSVWVGNCCVCRSKRWALRQTGEGMVLDSGREGCAMREVHE